MARPERFELPTAWFVARYSIQLSYGRVLKSVLESGGEGGIRTLEGLLTLTPLAGERFQPLSHLSEMRFVQEGGILAAHEKIRDGDAVPTRCFHR